MSPEQAPPSIEEIFHRDPGRLSRALHLQPQIRAIEDDYRPWRKFRHVAKDKGLDPTDAWYAAKLLRASQRRNLELADGVGRPFGFCETGHLMGPLHRIDRALGGGGPDAFAPDRGILGDEVHRTRLRIRTLMDEAVESSLIEGAATTRRDAIELLRTGVGPRTKGERMVVNNYAAMGQIKQWLDRPLSAKMLLEIQGILTDGTMPASEMRRFRRPEENVRVEHESTGEVIFVPPPAAGLSARIERLCDFANRAHEGASFIHPIVKAAILHFMIGFEHPFTDGNGRTARAIFYWAALRAGYAIFEYVPISERIRAGRARYPQAYLDSEQDGGDLTYFIVYHLDIVEQAIRVVTEHLSREEAKIARSLRLLRASKNLNLRQRLLLEHSLRHPGTNYTVKGHMNSNGITVNTARADLEGLVRRRLMTTSKIGRQVQYHVVRERLGSVPARDAK